MCPLYPWYISIIIHHKQPANLAINLVSEVTYPFKGHYTRLCPTLCMVGISILPNGFKAGSGLDCFVASNPFKKNNRCEPSNPRWLKIDAVALIETTNLADPCQLTPRNGCRIGSISLPLPPRYLIHILFYRLDLDKPSGRWRRSSK